MNPPSLFDVIVWQWLIPNAVTTALLTPVVWFISAIAGPALTFWPAVGIAAAIAFLGIVIIRINDNDSIDIL